MAEQIKVEIAEAIKLDPGKRYMILLDHRTITKATAADLVEALKQIGVEHTVTLVVNGDPSTAVKVIEDTPKS